jgi:hypothetical protein
MAAPRKRIRGKRARLKQRPRGFNLRKQHRALAFAAAEAHPDWEFVSEGGLRYTGQENGAASDEASQLVLRNLP